MEDGPQLDPVPDRKGIGVNRMSISHWGIFPFIYVNVVLPDKSGAHIGVQTISFDEWASYE